MSKRVLVTAGGSGLGLAIAKAFLEAGDYVHCCDVDSRLLAEFERLGVRATASVCDVAHGNAVEAMFSKFHRQVGPIEVLVNNAGIGGPRASIEKVTENDWSRCVAVNLTGAFHTLRYAIPVMKDRQRGSVINIVTASARTGLPGRTPYIASKWGLRGLTLNAARELGPYNIRVNGIFPGPVDNPRGRGLIERQAAEKGVSIEEATEQILSYVSMRTLVQPNDVAALCLFLASAAARHITGQEIAVDGNLEWEE